MNICMFTNTYLPHVGGVARSVAAFSSDLYRRGHRVLVVAPTFSENDKKEIEGVDLHRVPAIQNVNGSDFSVRIALPFVIDEAIDAFVPDLIHSHHPFLLGDAALRAARRRKRPLVFTHHTLYERYTHYVPLDSPQMKRFVIHLSTEYANLCNAVVAPSRSVADLIRERGVRTRVEEIPTGVDMEFFASGDGKRFRRAWGIPDAAPVIGHVGRLAPEKNLDYLAEAVTLCLKRHAEVCFVLVGDGPSRDKIRQVFEAKDLGSRLISTGAKSGAELADAYAVMDLFAFSSTSETQGMVLAEAMAARTPVVALDASGSREVVQDGENGRLLGADASPADFARALAGLLNDPASLDRARIRALKTAQGLSSENCAARLERLYTDVLKKNTDASRSAPENLDPWESLLAALKAEWDLISEKTTAAVSTLREEQESDDSPQVV
jgi:glycosyltransferase involved in cell wall biosynthesis